MSALTSLLYKAILSMDSYNRGYGSSIDLNIYGEPDANGNRQIIKSSDSINAMIGNAYIYDTKGDPSAKNIGFYGIAYSLAGQTIISFRGTDSLGGSPESGGADTLYGYGIGAGIPTGSSQGDMAINFYKSIVQTMYGSSIDPHAAGMNISLTGHSLGGGLAGYVADLYGRNATIFDNMTFEAAAANAYILSNSGNGTLKNLIYGSATPWNPNISGINAYYTSGEFLSYTRPTQQTTTTPLDIGPSVNLGFAYDGVKSHSMATLSILLYADVTAGGVTDWKNAAKYFWSVMYDNDFAKAIGMDTIQGQANTDKDFSGILRQIIAYSIIDEGTRIFGDTAIRAFYDDANDFGKTLSSLSSAALIDNAKWISQAFVQYAGQLALSKTLLTENASSIKGILTYYNDSNNHTLDVNFNEGLWKAAGKGTLPKIVAQDAMFTGILHGIDSSDKLSADVKTTMNALWGTNLSSAIEHFIFETRAGDNLSIPALLTANSKATFFIGSDGADTISGTGMNDIIYAGTGVNTVSGNGGNDIFIGGSTKNTFVGGTGTDALIYTGVNAALTINNGQVLHGGFTDSISEIEYVTLTNFNDTVTTTITSTIYSSPLTWDGGMGTDVFNVSDAVVYDMSHAKLYSYLDEIVLKNFEIINANVQYLAPDINIDFSMNSSGKILSSKGSITFYNFNLLYATIDYSAATSGALFNMEVGQVSVNGHTHNYDTTKTPSQIIGTNWGDTFYAGGINHLEFYSGLGNDVFINNIGMQNLIYHYTGGNDVVDGRGLFNIIIDRSISSSEISYDYTNYANYPRSIQINIANHGSILIQNYSDSIKVLLAGQEVNIYATPWNGKIHTGSFGNDVMIGQPNKNEYFYGGFGDDNISGGNGNDNLYGNFGNDTLRGETGKDILNGGGGDDTYIYNKGDGDDIIIDEYIRDNDTIILGAGINPSDVTFSRNYIQNNMTLLDYMDLGYNLNGVQLMAPDPRINEDIGNLEYTLTINFSFGGKIIVNAMWESYSREYLGAGVEKLVFQNGVTINLKNDLEFVGTDNYDELYSSNGNDVINGKGGDDTLHGLNGNDIYVFNIGDGHDWIDDTDGAMDVIQFGAGITANDIRIVSISSQSLLIYYGNNSNNDTIFIWQQFSADIPASINYNSIEYIKFFDGTSINILDNVQFKGTASDDHIDGTHFNDFLYGLDGNDNLNGDLGDDYLEGGAGNDSLYGHNGNDTASYLSATSGVTVSLNKQGMVQNTIGAGNDTLNLIENLTGSNFNDVLEGWGGAATLKGEKGNDTFNSFLASGDIYIGGDGIDTVSFLNTNYGWGITVNLSLTTEQNAGYGVMIKILEIENLKGSIYNDTLTGNALNNIIEGGAGNDMINGGDGNDTASYQSSSSGVSVNLTLTTAQNTIGAGIDTLTNIENILGSNLNDTLTGNALNNMIEGGIGNDIINGGAGIDTASYQGSSLGVTVNLTTTTAQNTVGAGTDTLTDIENLIGSSYNDILTGNTLDNTIEGGTGDDNLNGGAGLDTVSYASSSVAVTVNLALTTSQNTIGAGIDTLAGFENILGSSYNDILTGSSVGNIIYGGDGNDTLDGGLANDTLYGGTGNDKYIYSSGAGKGNDIIEDESGSADQISFGAAYTAANTTLVRFGQYDLALVSGGQNLFYIKNQFTLNGSIESIKWGDGTILNLLTYSHTLNGTAAGETLYGTSYGAAGDIINALGGADTIFAGDGDDVISGGEDDDILYGENGNDILYGSNGNDTLKGGYGIDTASYIDATSFVEVNLSTATSQNTLGSGNDVLIDIENLIGSSFNDTLTGDANANTIDGGIGNDIIQGGLGDDILIGGVGTDTITYSSSSSAITFNLTTLTAQNTGGAGIDTVSGFENIIGSIYNDTLTGDANDNTIDGGLGNDTLNGGAGIDTVSYANTSSLVKVNLATLIAQNTVGAGTDTLSGFENILGSAYNDTLTGDANANTIDGGLGNDIIQGGLGNDILIGGTGTDTISYSSSSSAITLNLTTLTAQNTGGAGIDTVSGFEDMVGSAYNDTLIGNSSSNKIDGGLGNDTLDGGAGTDTVSYASATSSVTVNLSLTAAQNTVGAGTDLLSNFENIYGSAFGDTLTGNANANSLTGSSGADILTGGLGADAFKFVLSSLDGTIDRITDFSTAQGDKIDLKDLLVGYDAVTKAITDFVEFTTVGANTVIKIDRDGTGTTYGWQQIAQLDNVTGLTDEAALKSSGNLIVA